MFASINDSLILLRMVQKTTFFLIGIFHFLFAQAQETSYNCFFKSNSAEYPSDSITQLQNWLNSHGVNETISFTIVAYTDTIGRVDYNDQLSLKRLENVAAFLKAKNYRIQESKSIGERYAKDKYTNHAAFRKVEIHLISKEKEIASAVAVAENERTDEQVFQVEKNFANSTKPLLEVFEEAGNNKTINLNIEFQNNSNVYIDEQSKQHVFYLAQYLKNNPEKKVMILGHVCCTDNYAVSLSRARKVYEDLLSYQINKNRLKFQGMSNNSPLVEEIDLQTQQQNRRVEVVFYE